MPGEILLVDDDALIRTVVADNLSEANFFVHTAATEADAFTALATYPEIRLAIVDYCLPRPIGIALCRQITERHPDVAVALFTGHSELATMRRGEDNLPILSKTLRYEQLIAAVEELLQGRQPHIAENDLASRAELLWKREARRETVQSVTHAMRVHYDPLLKEPVPAPLSQTMLRLNDNGS